MQLSRFLYGCANSRPSGVCTRTSDDRIHYVGQRFRAFISLAANIVIIAGDIIDRGLEELYLFFAAVLRTVLVPVHDLEQIDAVGQPPAAAADHCHEHVDIGGQLGGLGGDQLAPPLGLEHRLADQLLVVEVGSLVAPGMRVIRVLDALEGDLGEDAEASRAPAQNPPVKAFLVPLGRSGNGVQPVRPPGRS